jgi:hypothetical protein
MTEAARDAAPLGDEGDEVGDESSLGEDAQAGDGPEGVADDAAAGVDGDDTEGAEQSSVPGGVDSLIDSLLGALLDARPEVAEHVVRAAHELVLAGQALVDAAQQTIRDRRDLRPE